VNWLCETATKWLLAPTSCGATIVPGDRIEAVKRLVWEERSNGNCKQAGEEGYLENL
jgi:hypothetical protein